MSVDEHSVESNESGFETLTTEWGRISFDTVQDPLDNSSFLGTINFNSDRNDGLGFIPSEIKLIPENRDTNKFMDGAIRTVRLTIQHHSTSKIDTGVATQTQIIRGLKVVGYIIDTSNYELALQNLVE